MKSKLEGRLEGKVAVVTGASTGIGRSAMEMFAQAGARVVGVARTQSTLDEAVQAVKDAGGEALAVAGDLSSSPSRTARSG